MRRGEVFELGLPLDRGGPQVAHPRRFNPMLFMSALHDLDLRPDGMAVGVNSIAGTSARLASRGVLLDLPRPFGVDALEAGYPISREDLESVVGATGVQPSAGDVVLVRTGFLEACRQDWTDLFGRPPGLGLDTLDWIHEHGVAALAADTLLVEVRPSLVPDVKSPFHIAALVYMGLMVGELFDLEALAADCAADGVHDFLFVAPPLEVTSAVGSPVNCTPSSESRRGRARRPGGTVARARGPRSPRWRWSRSPRRGSSELEPSRATRMAPGQAAAGTCAC